MPQNETTYTGQDLLDMANQRLLGYQNAVDSDTLLSYLNEGKDELWAILKNLEAQYFTHSSQNTDNTKNDFFGPVNSTTRDYIAPIDLREINHIYCFDTGLQQTVFTYKNETDRDWVDAYRDASIDSLSNAAPAIEYYYTIRGHNSLRFAQFFQNGITNLQIDYTRAILDFGLTDTVDEIVIPYSRKIANYAVKKAILGLKDAEAFDRWREEWKDDILMITSSAGPRNQADPTFVADFLG